MVEIQLIGTEKEMAKAFYFMLTKFKHGTSSFKKNRFFISYPDYQLFKKQKFKYKEINKGEDN